jgi:pilus assembly protein Flp/PilA
MNILKQLKNNESGATLIEYALLATLIAVAAILAMQTLGRDISNEMTAVGGSITR